MVQRRVVPVLVALILNTALHGSAYAESAAFIDATEPFPVRDAEAIESGVGESGSGAPPASSADIIVPDAVSIDAIPASDATRATTDASTDAPPDAPNTMATGGCTVRRVDAGAEGPAVALGALALAAVLARRGRRRNEHPRR